MNPGVGRSTRRLAMSDDNQGMPLDDMLRRLETLSSPAMGTVTYAGNGLWYVQPYITKTNGQPAKPFIFEPSKKSDRRK